MTRLLILPLLPLLPLLLLLAACAMNEAQRAYLERNIERDVAAGNMSEDQAKELREGSVPDLTWLGQILGGALLSLGVVRVWRGGVNDRKGAAPKEAT